MIRILIALLVIPAILAGGCSRSDDRKISASGTIETTEITVSAKTGGEVIHLLAEEGMTVEKGDTLLLLDRTDLEIQERQAQANLAAAAAQQKLLIRGSRKEDLAQAEATLANAESDLRRLEELARQNAATQKQLEDARTRYTIARQAFEKLKTGARSEEIDAARARSDQAQAQRDAIRKKVRDTYVLSPAAGVITEKIVEEGEDVLPGSALFTISRLSNVYLMIYVSEEELGRVKLAQSASVYIDAFPEKPFTGKVTYISPVAEFTPKNIQTREDRTKLVFGVKVEVPNPDFTLKPGMPADAVIDAALPDAANK